MKIHAVEAKLFRVDGRTDKMKLIVDFHNIVNMPKYQHYTIACQYIQRGRAEI